MSLSLVPFGGTPIGLRVTGYGLRVTGWQGSRLTPDSEAYIQAGKTFLETGAFGTDYTLWPPLYPLMLASFGEFGMDYAIAASLINALIFILVVTGYGYILQRNLQSSLLVAVGLMVAMLSSPISLVFRFAWSDSPFVLLSFFAVYFFSQFLVNRKPSCLLWASVFLSACLLTRHVGVVVAFAFLIGAICFLPHDRRTIVQVATYGSIAIFPYLIWLFRTWLVSETLAGPRHSSPHDFLDNLWAYSKVLAHWVFPHSYFTDAEFIASMITAILIGMILAVGFALLRSVMIGTIEQTSERVFVIMCVVFILVYSVFIITIGSITHIDLPNDRYLSPIILPLVLVLLYGFQLIIHETSHIKSWQGYALRILGGFWLIAWLGAPNDLNGLLFQIVG